MEQNKYVKPVEAVRLTNDNIEDACKWLDGLGEIRQEYKGRYIMVLLGGEVAGIGHWIVKDAHGLDYIVLPDDAFKRLYRSEQPSPSPVEADYGNVEGNWENFWKGIVCNEDGTINLQQVKKELSDFYFVMGEVPKVYCHITGDSLSKIMYPSETVISVADDYMQRIIDQELKEAAQLREDEGIDNVEAFFDKYVGADKEFILPARVLSLTQRYTDHVLADKKRTTAASSGETIKWVKASDRLPDGRGEENSVIIKSKGFPRDQFGHGCPFPFVTTGFVNFDKDRPTFYFCMGSESYLTNENIVWLDESASPSDTREEAIKQLVELARDLSVSWDCDSDSHKYGTLCRSCEGTRLYNLYTQSLNK